MIFKSCIIVKHEASFLYLVLKFSIIKELYIYLLIKCYFNCRNCFPMLLWGPHWYYSWVQEYMMSNRAFRKYVFFILITHSWRDRRQKDFKMTKEMVSWIWKKWYMKYLILYYTKYYNVHITLYPKISEKLSPFLSSIISFSLM